MAHGDAFLLFFGGAAPHTAYSFQGRAWNFQFSQLFRNPWPAWQRSWLVLDLINTAFCKVGLGCIRVMAKKLWEMFVHQRRHLLVHMVNMRLGRGCLGQVPFLFFHTLKNVHHQNITTPSPKHRHTSLRHHQNTTDTEQRHHPTAQFQPKCLLLH